MLCSDNKKLNSFISKETHVKCFLGRADSEKNGVIFFNCLVGRIFIPFS